MNCPEFIDRLQLALDERRGVPGDPDLAVHVRACSACHDLYAAAQRLQRALELLPPPALPAGFNHRVMATMVRERYRTRQLRIAMRVAAVLLLGASGLWLAFLRLHHPVEPGAPAADPSIARNEKPSPAAKEPLPPPSLQAQWTDAREATFSLTRQLAQDTTRGARLLMPPTDRFSEPLPLSLEPPALSMGDMSRTVSDGLEPVTDSARRAWGMFRRLMPGDEKKKG